MKSLGMSNSLGSWAISCLVLALPSLSLAAEKPNFIVINVDDLGYADIGPYGATLQSTPHLDRMAREGRKLACFYGAPVCSPSRASLMTGCYPKRVLPIPGVLFPAAAAGLHPSEITVAESLKQAGYATGCVGKWHLGDQPEFLPTRQGFDYYYGLPYSNDMGLASEGAKSNFGKPLPVAKAVAEQAGKNAQAGDDATGLKGAGQTPLPLLENECVIERVGPVEQSQLVERYTTKALAFIGEHQDEPFFLYLPHSAVHFPHYPGMAARGKSNNGLLGDWVQEVDGSVGQVLGVLRDLKLDGKTLVLFTSDNGGPLGQGANNKPWRGGKGSTWEGGVRECTIVWWPGKIPADSATDEVTGMLDVLPTLVTLAGGKPAADRRLDGKDAWPLWSGAADAKTPHEAYYYFRGLALEAVRSGPWKLHLGKNELYQLQNDPGESRNQASDHPDVVERLRSFASAMQNDLGMSGVGPGCRALGKAENPMPLLDRAGKPRPGFGDGTFPPK